MLLYVTPYQGTLIQASQIPNAVFDPYFMTNTVRLFHCESFCNEWFNERGGTVTTGGDITISSAQSKFGTKSWFFNASGGISTSAVVTGTNSFTLEMWLRPTSLAAAGAFFETRTAATNGWTLSLNTNGTISLYDASSLVYTTSNTVSTNVWSHFAIVKNGSTITMYINGASGGSTTKASLTTENQFAIGRNYAAVTPYIGYIDEVRMTTNIARYTADFTVATKRFSDGNDYDYHWQNTVILAPLTSSANDEIGHALFGTSGNITYDATNSLFSGVNTGLFNSSWFAYPDSEDWTVDQPNAYLSGGYTWECWVRPSSLTGNQTIFGSLTNSSVSFTTSGAGWILYANGTSIASSGSGFTANVWQHVAVVYEFQVFRVFINGVLVNTTNYATAIANATGNFGIGITPGVGNMFSGRMADFRATKGIARYVTSFAVPPQPLPLAPTFDATFINNSIVLPFNGTNGATTFTDISNNAYTVTNGGGVTLSSSAQKFGATSASFTSATNSYLTLPVNAWPTALEDLTIEFWANITSRPTTLVPFIMADNSSNSGISISLSNTTITVSVNGNATAVITGTYTLTNGTWNHIAVTRNGGGRWCLYANGQIISTTYGPTSINTTTNTKIGYHSTTGDKFVGFIDDLRITRGYFRYNARGTFRPPTFENQLAFTV